MSIDIFVLSDCCSDLCVMYINVMGQDGRVRNVAHQQNYAFLDILEDFKYYFLPSPKQLSELKVYSRLHQTMAETLLRYNSYGQTHSAEHTSTSPISKLPVITSLYFIQF